MFNGTSFNREQYCMPSVPRMKILCAAMEEQNKLKRRRMLHEIFDGYNASSDWPGFAFLDDLLDMYPHVEVILNKRRTPDEWQNSVQSSLSYFSTWQYHLLTYWIPTCYYHFKMYRTFARLAKARYGVEDIFTKECYNRHNQWVRDLVVARGKTYLEWEPEDGWSPLCKLLRYDEPDAAFPRVNETAELEKLRSTLVKKGIQAWGRVLSAMAAFILLVIIIHRFSNV